MWVLPLALVGWLLSRAAADEGIPLRCRDTRCRYRGTIEGSEHMYDVDGHKIGVIYLKADGYFWVHCIGRGALRSEAMPRADMELMAWQVVLSECQLPVTSILDRLRWLNVTMLFNKTENFLVLEKLPTKSRLTTEHFTGLGNLVHLEMHMFEDQHVSAEQNFLAPLKSLRVLRFRCVKLPPGELNLIPPTLQELRLVFTGVERLPEAVYKSSSLIELVVESHVALDAVEVPPNLQSLELRSPATTLQITSVPELKKLKLTNWTETHPKLLNNSGNLVDLNLIAPAAQMLPDRWITNCLKLKYLVIQQARSLTSLPHRIFGYSDRWSSGLISRIAFKDGVLETLNVGQFDDDGGKSKVLELELNGNRLKQIPNATLSKFLNKLDLSCNDLDSTVIKLVGQIKFGLLELNLSNNPRLGDVCDVNGATAGYSPLKSVGSLKKLILSKTGVTRLCRDWREDMPYLRELDLSFTRVSKLSFEDLQFTSNMSGEVQLRGAPVTLLEVSAADFVRSKHTPVSRAFIHLDPYTQLRCDCQMYWTRRVLESSPHALQRISELWCAGGKLLNKASPEELVCARPEGCVLDKCTCSERPDDDPARDTQLFIVNCTGTAMDHVPLLPSHENRLYKLLLARNKITNMHAGDLNNVKTLDLRHNFITKLDEETATKLGNLSGELWLGGNHLDCSCNAAPLLQALHGRAPGYTDLADIYCSDGTALKDAAIVECPPSIAGYVVGLTMLFALAVAVIACLASRDRRFFAKAVLHRWGCLCCLKTDDDDRCFDAFLTFSHKDDDIARELLERLEPPYRLCIHHRDWVPGLRIPDQIVESVRQSRRTLALVSRHFLASVWTRVEFREAHAAAIVDAKPRLVVILLEDPAALALDEQLQRYIATHTYLRWGDPWFYDKLAVALPRPRQPRSVIDPSPLVRPSTRPGPIRAIEQKRSPSQEQTVVEVSVPLLPVSVRERR